MSVAKIILSQIKTLDRMSLFAWGAKDFVDAGDGLRFKTSGLTPWKGWVYIKYNAGTDLYDIDFYRVRKAEIKVDKTVDGVYAEDMVRVIDGFVG